PYAGSAIVSLHGAAGTWLGARVVAIAMDPATGLPLPAADLQGHSTGAMTNFATGWDDHTLAHGRPADLTFAPEERSLRANDPNGRILGIAPVKGAVRGAQPPKTAGRTWRRGGDSNCVEHPRPALPFRAGKPCAATVSASNRGIAPKPERA